MRTRVCETFGIDVPIFAFSHCRDVVAAVSAAGGLGVFGAATYAPEELEVELRWLDKQLHGRPYGVNVLMADSREEGTVEHLRAKIPQEHWDFMARLEVEFAIPPIEGTPPKGESVYRNMELRGTHAWARPQLEVVWRHPSVTLLVSALGPAPADVVAEAKRHGMAVGGMVGAARHAEKHIEAGAELLIAAGLEGAGHNSDVATMVLVPEVVDAAGDVPVLAAGGIASGRQIAASLALGAEGVWLGSLWLTTAESDFPEESIERMLAAGSRDTIRTRSWSGKPTRFLSNPLLEAWERHDAPEPLPTPLQRILVTPTYQRAIAAGMHDLVAIPAGQCIGQVTSRKHVRDVVFDLQQEYLTATERVVALSGHAAADLTEAT